MKTIIQRNPDANDSVGGNNAGIEIDNIGLGDDKSLENGKTTAASTTTTTNTADETPEAKATREAAEQEAGRISKANEDLAKQFGGVKLDDKGNAVDATGKIVKTADEIKTANAPVAVELDGVKYTLDKDGNALDKDGKVFKTKAEIDALENVQDEIPLVEEILTKSGIKIVDPATGKDKVYEDTPDGLLQMTNDIAEVKAKALARKFFDRFPEVEEFASFLQRGGDKTSYFKQQSSAWSNISFDDKNEEQLIGAVVNELMSKGIPKEQAELTAKTYKDTDKLKEFGKAAYTRLVNEEKSNKALADQQFAQQQEAHQKAVDTHWQTVNATIKKGTLNNITIPEADRENFFSYIALAANEDGISKADLEYDKLPIEQKLQLQYFQFKGFDLSKLIQSAVKQAQVTTLRKRTAAAQQGAGGGAGVDTGAYKKPNDVDVSMDNLQVN